MKLKYIIWLIVLLILFSTISWYVYKLSNGEFEMEQEPLMNP